MVSGPTSPLSFRRLLRCQLTLVAGAVFVALFVPRLRESDKLLGQDPQAAQREAEEFPKLLYVPIEGMITSASVDKTRNDIRAWVEREPEISHIVLELDTFGGELLAAQQLGGFLFTELKSVRTIVFVPPSKHALSAGALIAVSANTIVMGRNSYLGAAEPKLVRTLPNGQIIGIEDADEKTQSLTRQYFKTYARDRGYPTILTDSMVTKARSDIYMIKTLRARGELEVEETQFVTEADLNELRRDTRIVNEEVVLREGELLTLDADAALRYGFAKHIVEDLDELLHSMRLVIPPENVLRVDSGSLRPASPQAQTVVDFLNHPVTRSVLLIGGCLGLLLEFKLLGTLIPAGIGFFCFTVFFVSALFPVTGELHASATVYEILLFVIGLVLIGAELLFPGLAIFAISGVALCGISVVLTMMPGEGSQQGALESFQEALFVFLGSFALGLMIFFALLAYLPSVPMMRKRGLVTDATIVGVPTADSALDAQAQAQNIIGKHGITTTTLRPAGKVELEDGRLLDVVSDGEFIEKGTPVRVVESGGGRTVVARHHAG